MATIVFRAGFNAEEGKLAFTQALSFALDIWKDEIREYASRPLDDTRDQSLDNERLSFLVNAVVEMATVLERARQEWLVDISENQRKIIIEALEMKIVANRDALCDYHDQPDEYDTLFDTIIVTARILDRIQLS